MSEDASAGLADAEILALSAHLLAWFDRLQRDLPWRRTRDPYAIWISEIMLQQTRVAAVIPYYERFLARFPAVQALADAPETDLLAAWSGLGYYHRARNLQRAARAIVALGAFPRTPEEIRTLPGVGAYTAAAVASIAFDLPHAAVDGNVLRVLSRIYNDAADIASTSGKAHFADLAETLLDRKSPGRFNQAMMELGATVCLPAGPQCLLCPVAAQCRARRQGTQDTLPIKTAPRKSVDEHRTVFWIEEHGRLLLWQRPASSRLMPGFWELPEREHLPEVAVTRSLGEFRHGITFHRYRFEVFEAAAPRETHACTWIALENLARIPCSTILNKARRVAESRYTD